MKTMVVAGNLNEFECDFMIVDDDGPLSGLSFATRRKVSKRQKAILKAALVEAAKKLDELKKQSEAKK